MFSVRKLSWVPLVKPLTVVEDVATPGPVAALLSGIPALAFTRTGTVPKLRGRARSTMGTAVPTGGLHRAPNTVGLAVSRTLGSWRSTLSAAVRLQPLAGSVTVTE